MNESSPPRSPSYALFLELDKIVQGPLGELESAEVSEPIDLDSEELLDRASVSPLLNTTALDTRALLLLSASDDEENVGDGMDLELPISQSPTMRVQGVLENKDYTGCHVPSPTGYVYTEPTFSSEEEAELFEEEVGESPLDSDLDERETHRDSEQASCSKDLRVKTKTSPLSSKEESYIGDSSPASSAYSTSPAHSVSSSYTGELAASSLKMLGADSSTKKSKEKKGKKLKCDYCDKCFISRIKLKDHLKTHPQDRPHTCTFCDYRAKLKSTLENHMILHNTDKSYKCKLCPKSYTQKAKLIVHLQKHAGEKPYSCSICKVYFLRKYSLDRHFESKSHIAKAGTSNQ